MMEQHSQSHAADQPEQNILQQPSCWASSPSFNYMPKLINGDPKSAQVH